MKTSKSDNLCAIGLSTFLCYLTYNNIIKQLTDSMSDYVGHLNFFLGFSTADSFVEGWKTMPYFMWHFVLYIFNQILLIPLESAVAFSSIVFVVLTFYIFYWMIIKYCSYKNYPLSNAKAAFISFGLSVAQPLILSWIDTDSFSPNPIHNPTQMCVRPFVLLCLCLVYDIWNKQKDTHYTGTFFNTANGLKRPYIFLTVILFISAFAKPTFAEMFIPTVAIIMLIEWLTRLIKKDVSAKAYFKNCLKMFYCAIPTLLFILLQIFGYIILGGKTGADEGFIITKWLEVRHMFTENVILSIPICMTFPLYMLFIDAGFYLKTNLGKLSLFGYIIGFLEAGLLGEGGERLSHGNFIWPMISAMLLSFTVSMLHLLDLENTKHTKKLSIILINVAWVIFFLQVLSGLIIFLE